MSIAYLPRYCSWERVIICCSFTNIKSTIFCYFFYKYIAKHSLSHASILQIWFEKRIHNLRRSRISRLLMSPNLVGSSPVNLFPACIKTTEKLQNIAKYNKASTCIVLYICLPRLSSTMLTFWDIQSGIVPDKLFSSVVFYVLQHALYNNKRTQSQLHYNIVSTIHVNITLTQR